MAAKRLTLRDHVLFVAGHPGGAPRWAARGCCPVGSASSCPTPATSPGVVNPPGGTASFSACDTAELPADLDGWLSTTTNHSRSWWEDWAEWIADRAGERQAPPTMGNERWPASADAPGTYVLEL